MPEAPPRHTPPHIIEARRAREQQRQVTAGKTYDNTWRKLSRSFLARHPLCRHCEARGRITPATQTDHIIPVKVAPHRRLDVANLQPLCRACHSTKTQAENSGTR